MENQWKGGVRESEKKTKARSEKREREREIRREVQRGREGFFTRWGWGWELGNVDGKMILMR